MSFPTAQLRRLALTPPYRRTLKHHLTLATIFVFAFATYIGHAFSDGREQPLEIHARKLLNGLRNNQELRPKDIGSEHLQGALGNNQAEPRSLAAADFDEDGVPDLVTGHVSGKKGIVSLRRGNIDSIYPNTPEANQRKLTGESSGAPFLSPAHLFETPFAPDFLGAGDFNADGHWDVVLAARGIGFLSVLSGDGRGNFGETKKIGLPGTVTAVITGEINRADGLTDVIVAINGESGPQTLVFEGPSGAL
ncbi:MAG TPA: VCBS repeat-containing protein, partial [Pyrinomonadaceae bacterium]|nr:VCBS repeat-containing protein [Pyrinomonadaceae bacterium]